MARICPWTKLLTKACRFEKEDGAGRSIQISPRALASQRSANDVVDRPGLRDGFSVVQPFSRRGPLARLLEGRGDGATLNVEALLVVELGGEDAGDAAAPRGIQPWLFTQAAKNHNRMEQPYNKAPNSSSRDTAPIGLSRWKPADAPRRSAPKAMARARWGRARKPRPKARRPGLPCTSQNKIKGTCLDPEWMGARCLVEKSQDPAIPVKLFRPAKKMASWMRTTQQAFSLAHPYRRSRHGASHGSCMGPISV